MEALPLFGFGRFFNPQAAGGIGIRRTYRPWDGLLMVSWTWQTMVPISHRRPPTTLNDVHQVRNLNHEIGGTRADANRIRARLFVYGAARRPAVRAATSSGDS